MGGYVWLFVAIAAIGIGTMATYALLHARAGRRRWARYSAPEGSGKLVADLCPHCRQRIYSPRAMRERICPSCQRSY